MRQVLCYPFVGDSVGGAHLSAIELIRRIDRERYLPLIVLHEKGLLAEHLRREGLDYKYVPLDAYAGAYPSLPSIAAAALRAAPTLRRFLRNDHVSLVHCNDLRTNMTWVLACRLAGVRFVWHQRIPSMSDSLLWRLIPLFADHCVAISRSAAWSFGPAGRNLSIIDNPFTIPEKVNRDESRAKLLAEINGYPEDRLIGFVGRLVPHKRPELCVEILASLIQRSKRSVRLLFFGRGEEVLLQQILTRARHYGVEKQVVFMGFRSPIYDAIAGLDILLAPSEHEGLGRTLVEAMLVGTPVVASDIPAHAEVIVDGVNGLLAASGAAIDFSDQTHRIFEDKVMTGKIISTAKQAAEKRFSPSIHVDKIQSIYSLLLDE